VGVQRHALVALPPGKTQYPLYRRLGGPQSRSEQVRKISPPTGIRYTARPARSESLYRLSYHGSQHSHCTAYKVCKNVDRFTAYISKKLGNQWILGVLPPSRIRLLRRFGDRVSVIFRMIEFVLAELEPNSQRTCPTRRKDAKDRNLSQPALNIRSCSCTAVGTAA
jgi:hypothetical protein